LLGVRITRLLGVRITRLLGVRVARLLSRSGIPSGLVTRSGLGRIVHHAPAARLLVRTGPVGGLLVRTGPVGGLLVRTGAGRGLHALPGPPRRERRGLVRLGLVGIAPGPGRPAVAGTGRLLRTPRVGRLLGRGSALVSRALVGRLAPRGLAGVDLTPARPGALGPGGRCLRLRRGRCLAVARCGRAAVGIVRRLRGTRLTPLTTGLLL